MVIKTINFHVGDVFSSQEKVWIRENVAKLYSFTFHRNTVLELPDSKFVTIFVTGTITKFCDQYFALNLIVENSLIEVLLNYLSANTARILFSEFISHFMLLQSFIATWNINKRFTTGVATLGCIVNEIVHNFRRCTQLLLSHPIIIIPNCFMTNKS